MWPVRLRAAGLRKRTKAALPGRKRGNVVVIWSLNLLGIFLHSILRHAVVGFRHAFLRLVLSSSLSWHLRLSGRWLSWPPVQPGWWSGQRQPIRSLKTQAQRSLAWRLRASRCLALTKAGTRRSVSSQSRRTTVFRSNTGSNLPQKESPV